MKYLILWIVFLLTSFGLAAAGVLPAVAQTAEEGESLFSQKCASCHTVGGGKLVGPDLLGITGQRDQPWLRQMIADPAVLFNARDPLALQLLAEYSDLRMPNMGLTQKQVDAVVLYLEQASNPAAPPAFSQPLPEGNALAGEKLFSGEVRLANGGPACKACHTASGTGFLGGGTLGPDLTQVHRRYGEVGLASSLRNIAFPTMQGPYQNKALTSQEQADLLAYFQKLDRQAAGAAARPGALFVGLGMAGTLLLLGAMAVFWPRQRQSLSAQLRRKG